MLMHVTGGTLVSAIKIPADSGLLLAIRVSTDEYMASAAILILNAWPGAIERIDI